MNYDLGRRDKGPPRKDFVCMRGLSVHKMDQQWVSIGMLDINVCGILC